MSDTTRLLFSETVGEDRFHLRSTAMTTVLIAILASACAAEPFKADGVTNIGSRRELFFDRTLIESLDGAASLMLHQPNPQEVIFVTDEPWEGNTCAYYTLLQDGDLYRMYYRASHWDVKSRKQTHPEYTCYAESRDGIHWVKPKLGLFEFQGSTDNNIVWTGIGTHNFTPFLDSNPDCPPTERYKALAYGRVAKTESTPERKGLFAFQSSDGIRWSLIREEPVITVGAFDSQNLAFWDPVRKLYVDYHRNFHQGVRNIMTCTSVDFVNWTEPVNLDFQEAPLEHLYTNTIQRYPRAQHLLIGFPTRYQPRTQQVEPIFMSSRDGMSFHRWNDPVIPITAPAERDGNRCNYMTWGLLSLPGRETEFSVYASEAYYEGPDSRLRRFTYRVDGMASLHAGHEAGTLLTKPITFSGKRLTLNYRTRLNGHVRVAIEGVDGATIKGFDLDSSQPLRGDSIDADVTWDSKTQLSSLRGQPVRVRFEVKDADVYSYRFAD